MTRRPHVSPDALPAPRPALGLVLGLALATALVAGAPARAAQRVPAAPGEAAELTAVLPLQDRTGDRDAAAAVEVALLAELERRGPVLTPDEIRPVLRRLRLRNADETAPEALVELARELGATRLLAATLHEVDRQRVPRLTASARAYDGATGELAWVGFEGVSGLDRRGLLERGVVADVATLVPDLARRLLATPTRDRQTAGPPLGVGRVVLVPLEGVTEYGATAAAEAMTEATRAALFAAGVETVSANRVAELLRQERTSRWGGLPIDLREALAERCGAELAVTGTVEAFEVSGSELEPEPRVAVALRLLDVRTGRILWSGGLERGGWDFETVFRRGRIYSRGALAERLVTTLVRRLLDAAAEPAAAQPSRTLP